MRVLLVTMLVTLVTACGGGAATADAAAGDARPLDDARPVADAAGEDAESVDAGTGDAAHALTVRWTFATNGVPSATGGDIRNVMVSDMQLGLQVLGLAPEDAHEVTVSLLLPQWIRVVGFDSSWNRQVITYVDVPAGATSIDVVLNWIDEPGPQLAQLQQAALAYHDVHDALPPSGPITPALSCCAHPAATCPADPVAWTQEPWASLGFSVPIDHRFHYKISVAGSGADTVITIEARGDWDCDLADQSWSTRGRIGTDGQLAFDPVGITRPGE